MKSRLILLLFTVLFSCSKPSNVSPENELIITIKPINSGEVISKEISSPGMFQLSALPNQNYTFTKWTGDLDSNTNPLIINNKNINELIAVFEPKPDLSDEIEVYNFTNTPQESIFAIENGGEMAHIINKAGRKLKTFIFNKRLGNDIELMPDGTFLGIFKPEDELEFSFGGYGGILSKLDTDANPIWEYKIANSNELAHHDLVQLPNKNILTLVWERISKEDAQENGVDINHDIFTEKIVEINPITDTVVWEWRSWNHIVQERFPEKLNYGDISQTPNKININHNLQENGDLMHANAIMYDSINDLIFVSVNYFSEVWVIDHSLTNEETAKSTGGRFNVGGDLVYRFGNPSVYEGIEDRLFFNNHHITFSTPDNKNILIFNNGSNISQSTVFELKLPDELILEPGLNNQPIIYWEFTHNDLYFPRISGAIRLSNGNTLICEGDYGFWEVTPEKDIVWKYNGQGQTFWRAYPAYNYVE